MINDPKHMQNILVFFDHFPYNSSFRIICYISNIVINDIGDYAIHEYAIMICNLRLGIVYFIDYILMYGIDSNLIMGYDCMHFVIFA